MNYTESLWALNSNSKATQSKLSKCCCILPIAVTLQRAANTDLEGSQLPFSPKTWVTLTDGTIQTVKTCSAVFTRFIFAVGAKLAPEGQGKNKHKNPMFSLQPQEQMNVDSAHTRDDAESATALMNVGSLGNLHTSDQYRVLCTGRRSLRCPQCTCRRTGRGWRNTGWRSPRSRSRCTRHCICSNNLNRQMRTKSTITQ